MKERERESENAKIFPKRSVTISVSIRSARILLGGRLLDQIKSNRKRPLPVSSRVNGIRVHTALLHHSQDIKAVRVFVCEFRLPWS